MTRKSEVKTTLGRGSQKKVGRPSIFSQKKAEEICELISNGWSLRAIAEKNSMPTSRTIHRWLQENNEFCHKYARAREAQADLYADQIVDIADNVIDEPASVMKARLQIDARKWKASKLAPKKYGDKIQQEISGVDGKPIQIETKEEINLSVYSDDELRLLKEFKQRQDKSGASEEKFT